MNSVTFNVWRVVLLGLFSLPLLVGGATLDVASSSGTPTYSPLIYPSPVSAASSAALAQCPNPQGLVSFTTRATLRAKWETNQVAVKDLPAAKLATDPSLWSSLASLNSRHDSYPTQNFPRSDLIKVTPITPDATTVETSCGEALIAKTVVIEVIPLNSAGIRTCNDCTVNYYFIDRRDHVLLYGVF